MIDPKFPKGKQVDTNVKAVSSTLCWEATSPGHSSAANQKLCLPSGDAPKDPAGPKWGSASEGDVQPVKRPECTHCPAAEDLTRPGLHGAGVSAARL